MSNPEIRLLSFDLDCPDPAELARFYGDALDLPVLYHSDDFVLLGREGAPGLGFVRQAGFRPPAWPDPAHSKQAHLELGVEDLDAAQERMLALGAVLPSFQPRPDVWRVLLDPAGHPFCLSTHGI
ncbi:VOC family protein [Streptomyces xantholiticus]|uniref:VOC family protein n=1 Tax=Streptomyces xantholiticus TaxID=68285 RepID=UPI001671C12B|nr:VOC family protein [Streptomyces xantholiticus]GGW72414.1 glyoxalase [Streptomyces xantholiticus]